jgi:tetratricopeptide (TPR) repeat protein
MMTTDLFVGQLVSTPYGDGLVLQIIDDKVVVQPITWIMAQNQRPTFYMNSKDVQPLFNVGSPVQSVYGRGTITAFRESDRMFVITLDNWKLADGKSPTLYLNSASFSKVKTEPFVAANTVSASEKQFNLDLAAAIEFKSEATALFKNGDIVAARLKYMSALETLQKAKDGLSNKQKSSLFEQTVTCSNNVAVCSMRLKEYVHSISFASNALVLIHSLEKNIPAGQIWQCLLENGITSDKLRKEWKKKALFCIGKSELNRQNYQEAIERFEEALGLIVGDEALATQTKELRALLAEAQSKKLSEKKKEKATWSKAFRKNQTDTEDGGDSTADAVNIASSKKAGGSASSSIGRAVDKGSVKQSKIQVDPLGSGSVDGEPESSSAVGPYGVLIGLGIVGIVGGLVAFYLNRRRK